jgi:hypothetical protein
MNDLSQVALSRQAFLRCVSFPLPPIAVRRTASLRSPMRSALPAASRGRGNRFSFSRRISAPELCHATVSDSSPPDLIRWSMLRRRARTPVEALCERSFGMDCRIKSGNDERKNERPKENVGSETPTDATVVCRGFGHGRACSGRRTSIGVPPRFWLRRPNATTQLQFRATRDEAAVGCYP